eukprot:CAMPEP_0184986746 /NCGR_PEP_ID=MMETSP1098-20130426/17570_1 /TAXON_ID=89044 /ORGANISM="Spumella elongata, Strain CCAP 955/1" /LENGTH=147 /DNA_ID=CAMNT_0027511103 /DNA_START=93 /DNA_END=536 /DNA_ORIENTATION=+
MGITKKITFGPAPVAKKDESRVTAFDRKVYEACSRVPKGKVTTYKEIAKEVGSPHAHRAVGSSLRRNPYAPVVPCHRVVSASGVLAGFHGSTDPRGEMLLKKRRMLIEEGVKFDFKGGIDLTKPQDELDTSKARVNAACMFEFASKF